MNKKQTYKNRKAAAPIQAPAPARPSSPSRSTEFNPDYSYVIKDLRRIGILAGSFMAVLVVLSFFLR